MRPPSPSAPSGPTFNQPSGHLQPIQPAWVVQMAAPNRRAIHYHRHRVTVHAARTFPALRHRVTLRHATPPRLRVFKEAPTLSPITSNTFSNTCSNTFSTASNTFCCEVPTLLQHHALTISNTSPTLLQYLVSA